MAFNEYGVFIVVYNGDVTSPSLVTDDKKAAIAYCESENAKWPALQFRVLSIRDYGDLCYREGETAGYDEGVAESRDDD